MKNLLVLIAVLFTSCTQLTIDGRHIDISMRPIDGQMHFHIHSDKNVREIIAMQVIDHSEDVILNITFQKQKNGFSFSYPAIPDNALQKYPKEIVDVHNLIKNMYKIKVDYQIDLSSPTVAATASEYFVYMDGILKPVSVRDKRNNRE